MVLPFCFLLRSFAFLVVVGQRKRTYRENNETIQISNKEEETMAEKMKQLVLMGKGLAGKGGKWELRETDICLLYTSRCV